MVPPPSVPRASSTSGYYLDDQSRVTVTEDPSDSEGQEKMKFYDFKETKPSKSRHAESGYAESGYAESGHSKSRHSESRPSLSKHSSSRDSKRAPSTTSSRSSSMIKLEKEKKSGHRSSLSTINEQAARDTGDIQDVLPSYILELYIYSKFYASASSKKEKERKKMVKEAEPDDSISHYSGNNYYEEKAKYSNRTSFRKGLEQLSVASGRDSGQDRPYSDGGSSASEETVRNTQSQTGGKGSLRERERGRRPSAISKALAPRNDGRGGPLSSYGGSVSCNVRFNDEVKPKDSASYIEPYQENPARDNDRHRHRHHSSASQGGSALSSSSMTLPSSSLGASRKYNGRGQSSVGGRSDVTAKTKGKCSTRSGQGSLYNDDMKRLAIFPTEGSRVPSHRGGGGSQSPSSHSYQDPGCHGDYPEPTSGAMVRHGEGRPQSSHGRYSQVPSFCCDQDSQYSDYNPHHHRGRSAKTAISAKKAGIPLSYTGGGE
ncbi:hypothetical protein BOTCAL_0726g00030 [Botryotinia calthae]|uniref:Uncharacterized protein n=1 Tax=Botryotinia calthae TaxID=38488 RepID=A0A4Y8CH62_9HELO|nr:hypothetical protein BOTCAL_0726g00030 [Botryotinia calthae]